ncbi:NosD domain-containing protein [Methanococcoides methylutens]|uniref:NosD domain-containing protein n=1 Tax=Methanococcoides methylutens TaxID=2226 RepID=UPI00373AF09D
MLVDSDNNTLKNNDMSYSRLKGIWLWKSSNNILQNNTAIGSVLLIQRESTRHVTNSIHAIFRKTTYRR